MNTRSPHLLSCVEIAPARNADASVIWLHGLGANGHDFEPIVPELGLPADHGIRFVFPHAPARPVTINGGYVMPAWFDITSLERLNGVNENDINDSVKQINALIDRERQRGIAADRIVVAGFSQGGVIALHMGARAAQPLAGVMALSTYLPMHEQLIHMIPASHRITPVFMAHGLFDPVVPLSLGRMSHTLAQSIFTAIEWHEYPMEHSVCLDEIEHMGAWLRGVLIQG